MIGGKVYTQIYVPSTTSKDGVQNYAWIELVDPPVGNEKLGLSADEVLALLYARRTCRSGKSRICVRPTAVFVPLRTLEIVATSPIATGKSRSMTGPSI